MGRRVVNWWSSKLSWGQVKSNTTDHCPLSVAWYCLMCVEEVVFGLQLPTWRVGPTSKKTIQLSGYPLKLHFQIPCVFPVQLQIFMICDYYIHKTDLADLSTPPPSLLKKKEIYVANIEISFIFRIRKFTTCANQIPCAFPVFWQNFQIPCVFPDRELFLPFPFFPVQWVY